MTRGNYLQFGFPCPLIKVYWHTALLACIQVVCGHVCLGMAELNHCDRWQPGAQSLNYYCLALYRKSLPTLDLNSKSGEFMYAGMHISEDPETFCPHLQLGCAFFGGSPITKQFWFILVTWEGLRSGNTFLVCNLGDTRTPKSPVLTPP